MKIQIAKQIGIGLVVGILSNLIGCYLYILIFSEYNLKDTIAFAQQQDVLGNIIALGALLNLVVFYIFLQKKRYYHARGVLLATLIAAIVILLSKIY